MVLKGFFGVDTIHEAYRRFLVLPGMMARQTFILGEITQDGIGEFSEGLPSGCAAI